MDIKHIFDSPCPINYNAGEQTATLYTRDKTVMRKLDALVVDNPIPLSYNLFKDFLK